MINEDFCSYEVAKLLKEKGFDGDGGDCECHMFYSSYSKMIMPITEIGLVSDFDEIYYAPTHQMAMKWLREVHKVNIEIPYNRFGENYKYLIIYKPEVLDDIRSLGVYFHYEDTVEAALKYCLENLI